MSPLFTALLLSAGSLLPLTPAVAAPPAQLPEPYYVIKPHQLSLPTLFATPALSTTSAQPTSQNTFSQYNTIQIAQNLVNWKYDQNPYIKSPNDYVFEKREYPCNRCEHYCMWGNGFGAKNLSINYCLEKCDDKCVGDKYPMKPSLKSDL